MAGIEELLVSIVSKFDDAGFKKLDTSTTKATKATSILSKNLRGLFVGVIGTIGAKEILNASIRLETLRKQFENITGSRGAAEEQLRFIRNESDRLGLSFEKTVGSYRRFMTAGKSQGLSDANIQNIYSGAMDYATANQLRPEETEQLLSAMTNLLVKGQVSARGLTGQLGKVMPEALQLAAKSLGKTDEEFKQLIKDGLSSTTLLTAMGQQLHSDFSEKAIASADTVQGALNRIQNAWRGLLASILDDGGMEEVKKLLNEIANIINSGTTKQTIKFISQLLTLILKNIRLIGGIAAIMGIRRLIQTVSLLRLEFLTTTFAAGSLQAALQMDAGIASIKALTKASWGLLAPWLRIIAILLLVIEALDTIQGKKTVTRDLMNANPLAPKHATNFLDKNREKHPYLTGLGDYAVHSLSLSPAVAPNMALYRLAQKRQAAQQNQVITNNKNSFTFNIKSTTPREVANEVKNTMFGVFTNFGISKGLPQGTN